MTAMPSNSAVIAELAPAHLRGRYQSVFSLSFSAAVMIAPVLGGWVIGRFGDPPLWIGCFVLAVIAAAGHLAAGPARDRRMAKLRAAEAARTQVPEPIRAT
jgi:MFS family permease